MRPAFVRSAMAIRVAAAVVVALLALGLRLVAVDRLPTDFDEDDYLRAGQQYAVGLQQGDWGVFLRENFQPQHPPLNKILYGLAITPLPPVDEIWPWPLGPQPVADLPEPHRTAARATGALLGAAQGFALALVNPVAGLFLAVHATTVVYQSEIMLEALASLLSLLAVLSYMRAAGRPGHRGRWLAVAALFAGLAVAGKYQYGIVAAAIVAHWLSSRPIDRSHGGTGVLAWFAPPVAWIAVVGAAFLLGDPYLWPDPLGRLVESLAFHGAYARGAEVTDAGWPFWQQLVWIFGSVPATAEAGLILSVDLLIAVLAVIGLPRLWREHRVFALWLLLGLAFLLAWPTKWPQYVLMVSAPIALAGALGLGALVGLGRSSAMRLRAKGSARTAE